MSNASVAIVRFAVWSAREGTLLQDRIPVLAAWSTRLTDAMCAARAELTALELSADLCPEDVLEIKRLRGKFVVIEKRAAALLLRIAAIDAFSQPRRSERSH